MSTISSKHTKRQGTLNPNVILGLLVLILALVVFTPFTGNVYHSLGAALGTIHSTHANISTNVNYSFSADQQYWSVNCSHGWSSNSTCDAIVFRAQSCSISMDSAYCSEYGNYLKQFSN
jgi:hypothetical protein